MLSWDGPTIDRLVGRKVSEVWFSDEYLTFVTDQGPVSYTVEGDCCSHSLFNDFVGLEKLANGPITEVKEIEVVDAPDGAGEYDECVQIYGYSLTTEHPKWGPMTTVFSFRNESNGYYGGWMLNAEDKIHDGQVKLEADRVTS